MSAAGAFGKFLLQYVDLNEFGWLYSVYHIEEDANFLISSSNPIVLNHIILKGSFDNEIKSVGRLLLKENQFKTDTADVVNTLPVPGAQKRDDSLKATGKFKTEMQKPAENITADSKNSGDSIHNTEYNITILNPACTLLATESDFLKLRKKMAAEDADESMIVVAKRSFHLKCFTTEQVKNLGLLFLKDEGKYNFYDAAYGHVSDPVNFKNLQLQLTEEYYITRFKAMLH